MLVTARAVQGIGGAVASAVSLSLMLALFTEPADRAKAMGLFGFVASGGGSIGVVLGGVLTDAINWHWIFLVNLPIGVARRVPDAAADPGHVGQRRARPQPRRRRRDHGHVGADGRRVRDRERERRRLDVGHDARRFAVAIALFVSFIVIETRVSSPLMPLGLFRRRNLSTASVAGILWAGAMFAWFFLSALYMQLVLGYSPLKVGLGFLPGNLVMGFLSIAVSAKLVMRYGVRIPLAVGLAAAGLGLLLFARAPVDGGYIVDVLPGMILLGFGAGIAFNPVLFAAMSEVKPEESGLASGIVNTVVHDGRRTRPRSAGERRRVAHRASRGRRATRPRRR